MVSLARGIRGLYFVKNETDFGQDSSDATITAENNSSTENNKRKLDNEELAIKKLKTDIQENFHSRDKIINEFCELSECNTPEQIQAVSEHLL
ncbi:hypothetical protein GWI33_007637, partial [Rhynchophorus ferrugineus]